jgi:hypothetical protein
VTVEIHASFEAQRVAGAESDRLYAAGEQGVPELRRLLGGQNNLEAFFARVACACNEPIA